jgi:ABC-2 type transport system permease protein
MRLLMILLKREVKSYFSTPLPYIVGAIFSLVSGWIFFNLLANYVGNIQNLPADIASQIKFSDAVVTKLFGNINFLLLFLCPLVTMRLFAEEKKQNSIDLLYAAPISDWQIVLSKYLSSLSIIIFILALTSIFPIILYRSGLYETNVLIGGYFGLLLNSLCYLAVGIFASSITENQIVSAILGIVSIMMLWMITMVSKLTSNYFLVQVFKYIGLNFHFLNIVNGIITSVDLCYYFSFIVMFLLFTKKSIESRSW